MGLDKNSVLDILQEVVSLTEACFKSFQPPLPPSLPTTSENAAYEYIALSMKNLIIR